MRSDDDEIYFNSEYDLGEFDDDEIDVVAMKLRLKCMEKVGVDGNGGRTGLLFSKKAGKGEGARSILLL